MAQLFKKIQVLLLLVTVGAGLAVAQPQQDCSDVNAGLNEILIACRTSVSECVTSRNLSALNFLCNNARTSFDLFRDCQGELYSDQTFATFCSAENCVQEPYRDCNVSQKCWRIVGRNPGARVYEACQCSDAVGFNETLNSCSANCSRELQQLADDLGCCANTIPYALRFGTCGVQGENYQDETIVNLYRACNVDLPEPCVHPYSDESGSAFHLVGSMFTVLSLVVLMATIQY